MKQYPPVIELVTVFHNTYQQIIRCNPVFDVAEKVLRHNLINEEIEELAAAFGSNDFIEVMDALADITYVVAGAVLTHGSKLSYVADVPMIKVAANRSPVVDVEFAFVKEFFGSTYEHWQTTEKTIELWEDLQLVPDYDGPTTWVEWYSEREGYAADIVRAFDAINQRLKDSTTVEEMTECWHDLVELAYATSASYGVNLDEILEEVQRSNMSKLDENGNILKNEAGKVIKSNLFSEPDIEGVLSRGVQPSLFSKKIYDIVNNVATDN